LCHHVAALLDNTGDEVLLFLQGKKNSFATRTVWPPNRPCHCVMGAERSEMFVEDLRKVLRRVDVQEVAGAHMCATPLRLLCMW
jgi:hypothetical protein